MVTYLRVSIGFKQGGNVRLHDQDELDWTLPPGRVAREMSSGDGDNV